MCKSEHIHYIHQSKGVFPLEKTSSSSSSAFISPPDCSVLNLASLHQCVSPLTSPLQGVETRARDTSRTRQRTKIENFVTSKTDLLFRRVV